MGQGDRDKAVGGADANRERRRSRDDAGTQLEAENVALLQRLTRLRVALERLTTDHAALRRELKREREESVRLQDEVRRLLSERARLPDRRVRRGAP
jgi:predicted RNase H-like nuclease (RuvC/YqgF family)